ncbi:MAG: SDR family NAD(P)-dependent oxidoreductase, partial [Deltaproteobacteria bacterium]|nr:SDR family NAD(P)-dependent oxidoreductase [Deltaproteobacteria bacterium]
MKRILVTGANKGIGRALVEVLLERDDVQVLLGSRSLERGNAARQEILAGNPGASERLEVVEIDVSSDDSVSAAIASAASGGKLYGVVNNAGVGFGASDLSGVLNVNT